MAVSFAFGSCHKEEALREPVVTNVRLTTRPESIAKGNFDQWVAIQGNNLSTTTEVLFNTESAQLITTLITDTNVIVQIPNTLPKEFTGKLTLTTRGGIASFNFKSGPAPKVLGISNELAGDGTVIQVIGENFYNVDSVLFNGSTGKLAAQILEVTPKAIKVIVPQGTLIGLVRVVSVYGVSNSSTLFRDTTGMIMNFDSKKSCWGGLPLTNGAGRGEPQPIAGMYARGYKTNISPPLWWDELLAKATCGKIQDAVGQPVTGPSLGWALKFEVNVPEPWQYGHFEFRLNDTYFYRYNPWKNEDGTASKFSTEGWQTVTVLLNSMKRKTAANLPEGDSLVSVNDIGDLAFYFQNLGSESVSTLNVSFDNIRIVKIN
jgi:Surface glycan-binding protein B xyloglucan binding domain